MEIKENGKWYIIKINNTNNLLVPREGFDIKKEISKHRTQIEALEGMIKEHKKSIFALTKLKIHIKQKNDVNVSSGEINNG